MNFAALLPSGLVHGSRPRVDYHRHVAWYPVHGCSPSFVQSRSIPSCVSLRSFQCRAAAAGAFGSCCEVLRRRAGSDTNSLHARAANAPPAAQPITLTDAALKHLKKLRDENNDAKLLLRMGVKSGGCSGMSYHLDFESDTNVAADDTVVEYEGGFRLVCDPKSLLYLFGMQLDYSNALIGGGFQFHNPNALNSCGCGKSFGV